MMQAHVPAFPQPHNTDCCSPKILNADPHRHEHGAPVVDPRRHRFVLGLGHERQHQCDDRHRDVHPEDGTPRPLRQVAPEDRPDRGQAAGDAEEDGECPSPLTQGEGAHHDGERGREHERATGTLHDAEGHDPRFGDAALRRETAHDRGPGEDDHPEDAHAAMAEDVGQPPAQGEQSRQGQEIGVDHPLHAGGAEPELALNVGDGDGDDGLVDERHRDRKDHRGQDKVPVLASGRRHASARRHCVPSVPSVVVPSSSRTTHQPCVGPCRVTQGPRREAGQCTVARGE